MEQRGWRYPGAQEEWLAAHGCASKGAATQPSQHTKGIASAVVFNRSTSTRTIPSASSAG